MFVGRDAEIQRRIVLVGRSGAGKSACANTLFGRHMFLEARWGRFHTKECQRAVVTRFGLRLEVLDTPGFLLDSDITNPKVKRELAKTIGMSSPGPHIFVFVLPTPHMHRCDVEIFQKFVNVFGEDVLHYTILLFSKVDDLDYFSLTKQAFVLSAPTEWKAIMKACHFRCVWFQNRASPIDKDLMAKTFVETMEHVIDRNLGQYFCNDIYWTVEKTIIERDIRRTDQNMKLNKLRRKLRVNLDAGIQLSYGDTRKDPNRTREDFRNDLGNNKLKLIDTVWNVIKRFNCINILHRPKHLTEHQHNTLYEGFDLDLPNTDRSRYVQSRNAMTAAPPKMLSKTERLPKLDYVKRGSPPRKQEAQTERSSRIKLPRLAQKY